jgi:predicted O-methyltransferase YrrM
LAQLLAEIAREMVANPSEVGIKLWSKFRERPERGKPRCDYIANPDWERTLYGAIGGTAPRAISSEIESVWTTVLARLADKGINAGPASYSGYNDGDPAFIRAIWRLVRHLPATKVVETGVAHGVTSRFVLDGMAGNDGGRLWSIDLPPQTMSELHNQIGVAVDEDMAGKWTYIRGSSRRHLRHLLQQTGMIDLFIHDSQHTEYNMLFEMQVAWPWIRPGGAMVVDDIDLNWAFRRFAASMPQHLSLVCEAEPFRPDPLRARLKQKGLFGILVKTPEASRYGPE